MKLVTVEELLDLVNSHESGPYKLYFWNLDSNNKRPQIITGNIIKMLDNPVYPNTQEFAFHLDDHCDEGFYINFEFDKGEIDKFSVDHYQFSLYKS